MSSENIPVTKRSLDSKTFAGLPTRETNGIILERLWKACPSLCGGGADLVNSNKIVYSENDIFGLSSSFKGRYIRNGIREHAMASIANGIAAYGPGTFLPITATFFMFYIYVSISFTAQRIHLSPRLIKVF
jgi:dihydroxyacetone synthase